MAVIFHGCFNKGMDMAEGLAGWTNLAYYNDMVLLFPQTYMGWWDQGEGDLSGTNQGI